MWAFIDVLLNNLVVFCVVAAVVWFGLTGLTHWVVEHWLKATRF